MFPFKIIPGLGNILKADGERGLDPEVTGETIERQSRVNYAADVALAVGTAVGDIIAETNPVPETAPVVELKRETVPAPAVPPITHAAQQAVLGMAQEASIEAARELVTAASREQ